MRVLLAGRGDAVAAERRRSYGALARITACAGGVVFIASEALGIRGWPLLGCVLAGVALVIGNLVLVNKARSADRASR